jgi:hypothetical protein
MVEVADMPHNRREFSNTKYSVMITEKQAHHDGGFAEHIKRQASEVH